MAMAVVGSFLVTLGLIELLIRPFKVMRLLVGMKPKSCRKVKEQT